MTADTASAPALPLGRVVALFVCVLLVAVGLVWAWLSMRAVMSVGGACASGGAYEIATPCPDGAWLVAVGLPMMLAGAMAGSGIGASLGAPNLLLPMWFLVFSTMGWNFLEFGIWRGDVEVGSIVCGVVFELMALPVLFLVPLGLKMRRTRPAGVPGLWFWGICYLALCSVGVSFGAWVYQAVAT